MLRTSDISNLLANSLWVEFYPALSYSYEIRLREWHESDKNGRKERYKKLCEFNWIVLKDMELPILKELLWKTT